MSKISSDENAQKSPEESAPTSNNEHKNMKLKTTLVSQHTWDVFTPPPNDSLKGHFMPDVFTAHNRRRRISLEVRHVHLPLTKNKSGESMASHYEEAIFRILAPVNVQDEKASRREGKEALKILKKKRKEMSSTRLGGSSTRSYKSTASVFEGASVVGGDDAADDMSVMMGIEVDEEDYVDERGEISKAWRPKHKLQIDCIKISKLMKNIVLMTTAFQGVRHARKLTFNNDEEAHAFCDLVTELKSKQKGRIDQKLQAALGGLSVNQNDELRLVIEIVSAWDLPAADLLSSDPFVKVFLNGEVIHKTEYISNSLDPVWTVKTGSILLLNTTVKDLLLSPDGVMFQVLDFDQFGASDSLGAVIINPKVLFEANGERMEFKLEQAPGQDMETSGYLAIRCRPASNYDDRFMKKFTQDKSRDYAESTAAEKEAEAVSGGKSDLGTFFTTYKKTENNVVKYKVRPSPDPKREDETTWMSENAIEKETMVESQRWLDVGTGHLGRLHVEVLGCDDLPNLDKGVVAKNKTDAFVSLIFEDAIMKTDIIDDTLSPRWLPWSKRAFIFNMMHSSSQLFLGIYDYDGGFGNDHDLIGRVAVDVTNFREDTTYVLKYEIFSTANMTKRKAYGCITLRLRLEVGDGRRLLMGNLKPPPTIYVNSKTVKDFRMARGALNGKYDMEKYNKEVLYSYIDELQAYLLSMYHIQDAVIGLLLWRGHYDAPILGMKINFPLHSLTAFVLLATLVERPFLAPSFFFGSISWLMLALMGFRHNNPNVWDRCKTFPELLQVMLLGKSKHGPDIIAPNETKEEYEAASAAWKDRLKKAEEETARVAEKTRVRAEKHQKELAEIGEVEEVESKAAGRSFSIDPLKVVLGPIQYYLGIVCTGMRILNNVLTWEEAYFSFWITVGCFAISVAFLFVPWFFIMQWGSRIIVWTLFGPWMKLVDIFYYSKIKPPTEEEKAKAAEEDDANHAASSAAAVKEARILRENACKLKDMKTFMFGKFITRVPVLKQARYRDKPLSESYAVPYEPEPVCLANLAIEEAGYNRTRLPGQQLIGDIIPRVANISAFLVPVGKATGRTDLLDKECTGANLPGTDSNVSAYAKIGSIILGAGVITWFGVPAVTSLIEKGVGF